MNILRDIKITEKSSIFWCSSKCQGEDEYTRNKISKSKFRNGKVYNESTKFDLPPPADISYDESPILYDADMNLKLHDFFYQHSKSFSFWIEKCQDIKKYLFEKSYPIDATQLKIETRVKWVLDKMQRFPTCRTCGRPIDFIDVKLSRSWPQYCCVECKKSVQGKINYDRHASKIYERMLNSEWIRPLFNLEDFRNADRRTHCFDVKCSKCGGIFSLPFNLNFYARTGKRSYFRCPECFPFLSRRKKSKEEQEIYEYIVNQLHVDDVVHGDRSTIYPFELDVHPMKEYADIAIEYNGTYWHSLENGRNETHVLDKTIMCEDAGIKLITIWEDEFLADKQYWFDFLHNVFLDPGKITRLITCNGEVDEFEVDRSLFNKVWCFPGYELIAETSFEFVSRKTGNGSRTWTTPTAGKLIYKKLKTSDISLKNNQVE